MLTKRPSPVPSRATEPDFTEDSPIENGISKRLNLASAATPWSRGGCVVCERQKLNAKGFLSRLIAMMILWLLVSFVGADTLAAKIPLRGNGIRVQLNPDQNGGQSADSTASATCNLRLNQRNIALHFEASSFEHLEDSRIESDTLLEAFVSKKSGPIHVAPAQVTDQTDVSGGDHSAKVSVGAGGNGRAEIKLRIGMASVQPVAGKHCANVVMTITAN